MQTLQQKEIYTLPTLNNILEKKSKVPIRSFCIPFVNCRSLLTTLLQLFKNKYLSIFIFFKIPACPH